MLPALVVVAVLSAYFRHSLEVLKVHLLLKVEVHAPVAQPLPVVLALYQDKGTNGKP